MNDRQKILLLIDEIGRHGLPQPAQRLAHDLSRLVDIVIVAQCYLKPGHRARHLPFANELYGFEAAHYDRDVANFTDDLLAKHNPRLVLAYGWENTKLVTTIDVREETIVCVMDRVPPTLEAEGKAAEMFSHATAILFADRSIPDALTTSRWELDARAYGLIDNDLNGSASHRSSTRGHLTTRELLAALWPGSARASATISGTALHAACIRAAETHERNRLSRCRDHQSIEGTGYFNAELFGAGRLGSRTGDPIASYLHASARVAPRGRLHAGRLLRRPIEGFNPLIYAAENDTFDETSAEDPLAHYLRTGSPKGRWTHDVIRPALKDTASPIATAIHAHFHYVDLLPDFLDRITLNLTHADLFITTTSQERLQEVHKILNRRNLSPKLLAAYENRGRDLWPFFELLCKGTFCDYSVVGHFHGKQSPHFTAGENWRNFLWRHLLGGRGEPMMDAILDHFASDESTGLVFAEDPHLEGWEQNLELATDLAAKSGIKTPLPNHFDYPMGTMFWARPEALMPLCGLSLTQTMMPEEPIPIDGTILHALERLIPFFVAKAGFCYATSHVPGSTR